MPNDIEEITSFLIEGNPESANRFVAALRQTVADIARMPGRGAIKPWTTSDGQEVRGKAISGFRSYFVFFIWRESHGMVEIVAIVNGYRDLEKLIAQR